MNSTQIPWKFTPIPIELDSYGLDPYTYRIFTHVMRRQECFASLKSIAALCGMSVRQAQHALKTLELNQMVEKHERRGRTNVYTPNAPEHWKQPDYSMQIEKADAQDYFNQAILRRERKDFQGALEDLRKSLELYEQELSKAKQQGKTASRKKQDIKDTKTEILRLVERRGSRLDLDEDLHNWIQMIRLNHTTDSGDFPTDANDLLGDEF